MAKKKIQMPILGNKENKKNIIKSKTFWANTLLALAIPFLPQQYKTIISSPEMLTGIFTALNISLRLISKDKVSLF